MKVYLVSTGIYSDYEVRGIYSTMEKAKMFSNLFDDDNYIKTFEIDKADISIDNEYPFCVRLDKNHEDVYFGEENTDFCKQKAMYFYDGSALGKDYNFYQIFVYAKDRVSAIKIAKERHMQFLALNMYKDHKYINFITKKAIK